MAYSNVVASLLVALISSLISCVQINAAVINLHSQYFRDRQDVLRLLSMNSRHNEHCKLRESRHTCQHKIPSRFFWQFALCSFVTVSSSSTLSSVHLLAYFFLTFSDDLDIFLSDKLQASTVNTSQ